MRIASLQPSITLTLCAHTRYCLHAILELAALNLPILHDTWTARTEEIIAANPTLFRVAAPF